MFTRLYCKASSELVALRDRMDQKGQGTLEYVGMIALAGLLIAGLIAVFQGTDLSSKVSTVVDNIMNI